MYICEALPEKVWMNHFILSGMRGAHVCIYTRVLDKRPAIPHVLAHSSLCVQPALEDVLPL